mmetsp:Transcript_41291/g.93153  ORF Transcript_41291/g.93153 Transcript_41291/m.93153 type:complete len:247 (-) Transcript_41291:1514-2254(-)
MDPNARVRGALQLADVQDLAHIGEEFQGVDGDLRLAGMQLQGGRHEALREEKARDPEAEGWALEEPVHHELDPQDEVGHPGVQWLQAWVRHLGPVGGHLLDQERVVHALQVSGHEHDTRDRLAEHLEAGLHDADHRDHAGVLLTVEHTDGDDPSALSLLVRAGVGLLCLRRLGDVLEEVLRHLRDDVLGLLAAATGGDAGLHAGDGVEKLLRLPELRRDEGVGVQSEHARVFVHRQRLQVCPGLGE